MIKGEIKRYLRDNTSIRISRSLKDIYNKCREYQEEYFKDYGRLPGYEIIAEHLGVSTYDVVQAMESSKDPISMYEVIYNDGGDAIYVCDQIEDTKTNAKDLETRMTVDDALNKLDPREQFIIDERFVVGKTQMEVAEELMISQAQVSRLEHGAIKQLRKILR